MTGRIGLAGICVLLLFSCVSQKKNDLTFERAPLFGMVYDEDNQPCAGVQLSLDGIEGPATDIRGRFVFADLARGDHALICRKQGYEEFRVTISFLNRTDVLHLRMMSFNQLLARAERALGELKWREAEEYLHRAESLDAEDDILGYLFAIHALKTGNPQTAVQRLTAILSRGHPRPHVYLLLADVYQYSLNEPVRASDCLRSYLKMRGDPEVEKRFKELQAESPAPR